MTQYGEPKGSPRFTGFALEENGSPSGDGGVLHSDFGGHQQRFWEGVHAHQTAGHGLSYPQFVDRAIKG
jgi:hypothetical protein